MRFLRGVSDWVDLQWSLLYRALEAVAPRAHGRLLDVGCGQKQFELIFRPHVDEYLGIEHQAIFEATAGLHEEPHDYFRFTPHGLRVLLSEAGLAIEHIEQVGSLWNLLAHKLNSYLAFRVARIGRTAQQLGKLGHEFPAQHRPRLWALPFIVPAIVGVAATARFMDRIFFDREEAFGFVVVARHKIGKGTQKA